jgi:molecular chaperone HscB
MLALSLQASDFELFDVPEQFDVALPELDARWKALQQQVHPDRFAADGAAAQRVAMQWSVRINEAYQRLKDPIKRATYLCARHGVALNAETNTAMPSAFLMQQMQWREDLDDATTEQALTQLLLQAQQSQTQWLQTLRQYLNAAEFLLAAGVVRTLMFIDRFVHDVNQRIDQLDA